jgi:hypothetical protein
MNPSGLELYSFDELSISLAASCCFCLFASHTFQVQGGKTGLMLAALQGHTDCVRLLVEAGADTEAKDFVRHVFSCFEHLVYRSMITDSHCGLMMELLYACVACNSTVILRHAEWKHCAKVCHRPRPFGLCAAGGEWSRRQWSPKHRDQVDECRQCSRWQCQCRKCDHQARRWRGRDRCAVAGEIVGRSSVSAWFKGVQRVGRCNFNIKMHVCRTASRFSSLFLLLVPSNTHWFSM